MLYSAPALYRRLFTFIILAAIPFAFLYYCQDKWSFSGGLNKVKDDVFKELKQEDEKILELNINKVMDADDIDVDIEV